MFKKLLTVAFAFVFIAFNSWGQITSCNGSIMSNPQAEMIDCHNISNQAKQCEQSKLASCYNIENMQTADGHIHIPDTGKTFIQIDLSSISVIQPVLITQLSNKHTFTQKVNIIRTTGRMRI